MNNFNLYSRYYDLLYKDKDYLAEVEFVAGLIEGGGTRPASMLELGCGTGIHAALFAQRGYEVHGIDLSAQMLESALRRREQLGAPLQRLLAFDHGDVRSWRAGREFDVVVSLFHVFSYQTTNADLDAAFRTAAVHLRSGGRLVCDFWYGPAVLTHLPETRIKRLRDDNLEILRIAEPEVHLDKNVVDVNYEIRVVGSQSQPPQTLHETHSMRYLFQVELEGFAQAHGLVMERSMAWLSSAPLDASTWSGCAVFRKA